MSSSNRFAAVEKPKSRKAQGLGNKAAGLRPPILVFLGSFQDSR